MRAAPPPSPGDRPPRSMGPAGYGIALHRRDPLSTLEAVESAGRRGVCAWRSPVARLNRGRGR
jgi:hypothetical protein